MRKRTEREKEKLRRAVLATMVQASHQEVAAHPPDSLGRVIGKGGRIANAVRTLVRAAGTKGRKSIWVNVNNLGDSAPPDSEGRAE